MYSSRSALEAPAVTILVERRYLAQAQPRGLTAALARRGARVRTVVAEEAAADLTSAAGALARSSDAAAASPAVVCARGRNASTLALLRALEGRAALVHSAAAVDAVVDKAGVAARLSEAGVPTPRTWLGHPARLGSRTDLVFPLLVKPLRGDNAIGLAVVGGRAQLRRLPWPDEVAVAQPFHRGDAHDLKIYVADERVWAVRRPSPIRPDGSPTGDTSPGEQLPVTPAVRALAERCRAAFGLRLFGIDCVGDDVSGPLVVDVNEFPNYRGIAEDVDDALATVVLSRAARVALPQPVTA